MLRDLSESLQALLTQPGLPPELGSAVVSFDRPSDPFTPAQTTVNLFLFEVRENRELRNNEPVIWRQGNPLRPRLRCRSTSRQGIGTLAAKAAIANEWRFAGVFAPTSSKYGEALPVRRDAFFCRPS